jgi:hypothetical protein
VCVCVGGCVCVCDAVFQNGMEHRYLRREDCSRCISW